jgi:LAGLIDADG DNA endonuclease family protein
MDKYIFDLITSWSLICKNNYTTIYNVKKRLTKVERLKININSPINEILIGLLLGDGHLQCRNGNNRFIYAQSSLREHHLNYFHHIFDLFKPFISKEFKIKSRSFVDKRTKNTYSSICFATLTLPCFTFYRNLFYNVENKKIVPLNINQLLTPRALAYWIMDDGSLQNKGLHLSTYNFTYDEIILLKSTLENLFAPDFFIKCSIHNHKKGYRIYIWEESMSLVKDHIFQYMHKDMLYKITPK